MKIIKRIGLFLLGLVALVLIVALFIPTQYDVNRSVTIEAPPAAVWPHVQSLEAMDKWSPWNELDPNQTKTFTGNPGEIGSQMSWQGNDDVGRGEQIITASIPQLRVDTDLKFYEPWESESQAYILLKEDGFRTEVTWGFTGTSGYPQNIMNPLMGSMLGKDFDKGLALLKNRVETSAE